MNANTNNPSTGEIKKTNVSDTSYVSISAKRIKCAVAQMIELRNARIIINEYDSLSKMKDDYIREQKVIIADFQKRVNEANKINQQVANDLRKAKSKNRIIGGVAGSAVLAFLLSLIFN